MNVLQPKNVQAEIQHKKSNSKNLQKAVINIYFKNHFLSFTNKNFQVECKQFSILEKKSSNLN